MDTALLLYTMSNQMQKVIKLLISSQEYTCASYQNQVASSPFWQNSNQQAVHRVISEEVNTFRSQAESIVV